VGTAHGKSRRKPDGSVEVAANDVLLYLTATSPTCAATVMAPNVSAGDEMHELREAAENTEKTGK
jgi:hypothetical protein